MRGRALQATGADNVGGPWRASADEQQPMQQAIAAAFQSRWLAGGARSRQLDHSGWVDTVYLGAWPRASFERFGGFDENLVRNQDDEHNLRIHQGGGRVWQSAAIRSSYRPRGSVKALFRQYLQYGYWKPFVMKKHGQPAALRHLLPGLLVVALSALLLAALVRRAGVAAGRAGGPLWRRGAGGLGADRRRQRLAPAAAPAAGDRRLSLRLRPGQRLGLGRRAGRRQDRAGGPVPHHAMSLDRPGDPIVDETDAVRERYARRAAADWRYHRLNPAALLPAQERERAMAALLARLGWRDLGARDAIEVGCGAGHNLLELLHLGFEPGRLAGIELLPERHAQARRLLPEALTLHLGDAVQAPVAPASQDLVYAATVFSSLLDEAFRQQLAAAMWRWVKPGGGVLWYDFTVDNPRNPDVRGVPLQRVQTLFPEGRLQARRLTLAPPVARAVCGWHPMFYALFNTLPLLRTHVLAWIEKPAS